MEVPLSLAAISDSITLTNMPSPPLLLQTIHVNKVSKRFGANKLMEEADIRNGSIHIASKCMWQFLKDYVDSP